MTNGSATGAQHEAAGADYVGLPLTEEMQRTIVMAAATLAAGTMSIMRTAEYGDQMERVVERAFELVLKAHREKVATARA